MDELCSYLNLKRVGWIFTDLWSADSSKGTVRCTRHKVFKFHYFMDENGDLNSR